MKLPEEGFALSRANLYEQIADTLESWILANGYTEDGKLPSEQALADEFGVSRNVIREALKLLKERGLVESRNGTGSYITKPAAENLSDVISRMVAMDHIDYLAIYEIRSILETAACQKAAQIATQEQLAQMQELLEKLKDRSISVEERREMDFAFHIAIAQATDNPLLVILVQAMKNIFIEMIEKGIFISGGIDDAIKRHNSIMQALMQHDAAAAEQAMREHLEFSRKNVEAYMQGQQAAGQRLSDEQVPSS
ncbi:MAG: FadR/GntR family transcriptional regulator [Lachnospiraceae bacterium]|uniref:FadR/GntR family transcriptional regulator n=1 Tax=Parablautia sp. Marseille-Q6255 TaxID=3039593 RepID=UPI0024BD50EE|nr:FadR/GntR family transcriptional regulator [Parablautia sp. Marseille-Q6255]